MQRINGMTLLWARHTPGSQGANSDPPPWPILRPGPWITRWPRGLLTNCGHRSKQSHWVGSWRLQLRYLLIGTTTWTRVHTLSVHPSTNYYGRVNCRWRLAKHYQSEMVGHNSHLSITYTLCRINERKDTNERVWNVTIIHLHKHTMIIDARIYKEKAKRHKEKTYPSHVFPPYTDLLTHARHGVIIQPNKKRQE